MSKMDEKVIDARIRMRTFFERFKRDEAGVSNIVSTVLIILIVVVLVGVLWTFLGDWFTEIFKEIFKSSPTVSANDISLPTK